MKVLDHIKKRRSARKFKETGVSAEAIEAIIEAGRNAPSAMNSQPWKFYIVRDKNKRAELSGIHRWAGFIEGAPVCIVVAVDQSLSPNHFVEDGSTAAQNMLLVLQDFGLAGCWVAVHSNKGDGTEDAVRKTLDIPDGYRVICILAVGHPDSEPGPKRLKEDIWVEV